MAQASFQVSNNERVHQIMDMLLEGISREKISEQFGYRTWKSLDVYMRRHGFSWDSQGRIYTNAAPKVHLSDESNLNSSDVNPQEVIQLFSHGILDSREIAKRMGFSGHKEMAMYMLRHDYVWSAASINYINSKALSTKESIEGSSEEMPSLKEEYATHSLVGDISIDKYGTLLEFLWQSRDILIKVIESKNGGEKIQVYNIPGQAKTKSVYLSDGISDLMLSLCQKHNLSQKQGYEAALVEFLSKYGFHDRVEELLEAVK